MHDLDQLLFGAAVGVLVFVIHLGQVGADVVFQHHGQQAIHGASAACDLLQYGGASLLLLQGALDGIELAANPANAVK
ncbi:hypothetical protein BEK68_02835 [Ralstonia pickettii]|nr:hypothetical protein BEK68_02835 [Ralstonia pickettii]